MYPSHIVGYGSDTTAMIKKYKYLLDTSSELQIIPCINWAVLAARLDNTTERQTKALGVIKMLLAKGASLGEALFDLPAVNFIQLIHGLKIHQNPLPGSLAFLDKLKLLNVNLFSITDNVKEILEYHRINSAFPQYFKDIISSADIGVLKPNSKIYNYLITKHNLNPAESLFIDDALPNVEGAITVGMHAFQFTDHTSCEKKLMTLLSSKSWYVDLC